MASLLVSRRVFLLMFACDTGRDPTAYEQAQCCEGEVGRDAEVVVSGIIWWWLCMERVVECPVCLEACHGISKPLVYYACKSSSTYASLKSSVVKRRSLALVVD